MNTMWNNPVSRQKGLHTSHRTEHDIWSFTVPVHPMCILHVTEVDLFHIIIINLNFLKNSTLYVTLLTQNTNCTIDYNFFLINSSSLVVVLLGLQVKWQSRSSNVDNNFAGNIQLIPPTVTTMNIHATRLHMFHVYSQMGKQYILHTCLQDKHLFYDQNWTLEV